MAELTELGIAEARDLLAKGSLSSRELTEGHIAAVADAATLNVTMTPEYFVNGKPMPSFGWEQLQGLVEEALAEAGR